jgi:AcrR family transcriptional regulator
MTGVAERFTERTRERLRAEILETATSEVLTRGWRGLRMQVVADAVGVSRQTLYNEYANKQGLARALALSIAGRYHREVVHIIGRSADVREAIRETVAWSIESSAEDTLFKILLGADGGETFLPLYTSEGAPVVEMAMGTIGAAFQRRFPELDPTRLALVVETGARYVLSHLVLRTRTAERIAGDAASLFGDYLLGPPAPAARPVGADVKPVSSLG